MRSTTIRRRSQRAKCPPDEFRSAHRSSQHQLGTLFDDRDPEAKVRLSDERLTRKSQSLEGLDAALSIVNRAEQAELHKPHVFGHLAPSGSWLDQATADKRELKAQVGNEAYAPLPPAPVRAGQEQLNSIYLESLYGVRGSLDSSAH